MINDLNALLNPTTNPDNDPPRHPEFNEMWTVKYTRDLSGRKPGPTPEWLNKAVFRETMFRHVNTIVDGQWESVSTDIGIVWYRYPTLINVLREASFRDPGVLALAVDVNRMDDLVFTTLKASDDCVLWGYMGDGYSRCKCNVYNSVGRITETAYLTPVKTGWFNQLPSWLDRQKTDYLQQAVSKIEWISGDKNGQ